MLGTSVDAIDLAEDRGRFGALLDALGYKAPPYATAHSRRRGARAGARRRLPAARAPELRARRPRDGDRLLASTASPTTCSASTPRDRARRSTWTASSRTRSRSTSTRSATARTSGSAGSCSTSRRPASTPATPPACCRRTRSATRCSTRSATQTSGIALGARRRRAAQRAVRGPRRTTLYVIEANPRASRTVPFVSKAIGLPLAKLACRVMLGERLADLDLPGGAACGGHVSRQGGRAAVRPLRGRRLAARPRDALDRRGDGRSPRDFPTAFAKAQAAAGARAARPAGRCSSRWPTRDKPAAVGIAAIAARPRLRDRRHPRHRAGDRAHGHPGRATQQDRRGLAARRRLDRARRGRPRDQHADGHRARAPTATRSAAPPIARGIPCITTMLGRDGGGARDRRRRASGEPEVLSLQEIHARALGRCRRVTALTPRRRVGRRRRGCARWPSAERASAPTSCSRCRRPGRARAPRAGPVLHARRRRAVGRGGRRAAVPAARVQRPARAGRRRALEFLLEDVGPGTEAAGRARPGDELLLAGPLGIGFARRATAAGALLVGGGVGIAPLAIWQDELGAGDRRPCCSASATPPTPPARDAARRRARSPPTTARAGHHGLVTELLARRARRRRRTPRSTPAGRRRCSRRSGALRRRAASPLSSRWSPGWRAASARASAASCRPRDGYMRLCVDGPVLDARARACAAVGRALTRSSSAASSSRTRSSTASGTFDAIAARRAFGDALLERFPFAAFVSKTITLAPRAGQPAAAAVGARRPG